MSMIRPPFTPVRAALAALLTGLLSAATLGAEVLRLGTDVTPTFEAIELHLDADQTEYRGTATIELAVHKATRRVRFHARDMTLDRITLEGPQGAIEVHQRTGEEANAAQHEQHIVGLSAAESLVPGAHYTLRIAFSNRFNTQALSLYRMEQDGRGYLFTQFEDVEARGAFPCWDEPGFKIPYQLTLTVPAAQMAISNTPGVESTTSAGQKRIVFQRTPPLPSYLLAIAVGTFETVPIPGLSVPGRIITLPGQSASTGLAAAVTPPLLAALESWFARPYPYAKLDLIAIPEYWFGAMENAGAITFSEGLLVIDPATATTAQRRSQARVIAHEMAHMWFGDLVTMAWWDDLWLNESFADWMADKITDQVFPEFDLEIAAAQDAQRVMIGDARASTNPVKLPVESLGTLLQNAGLAYNKGKTVLDMFEQWLGPEKFRQGVLAYLDKHAWGNARAEDLWQALDHASEQPVAQAMASFIEQPGVPRVDLRLDTAGQVTLRQTRFANAGVTLEPMTWRIPVTLRWPTATGTDTRTLLLGAQPRSVKLTEHQPPAWVLPLAEGRGYYRWTLPADDLDALVAEAVSALEPRERVAVIGNLRALLDGGLIHGGRYLELLTAFGADPEPQVISALVAGIGAVETALIPPELDDAFGHYLRRTLGPALERFGMKQRPGEDETISLVRPRLIRWLGDQGSDPRVLRDAQQVVDAFLADPGSVDRAIAGAALGLVAHRGDRALFDSLRTRFETAKNPNLRGLYLGSLGEFRKPAIRELALAYALAGPLRPTEIFAIPGSIADDEASSDLVLAWLLQNYDDVAGRLPPSFRVFLPGFGGGCSRARWQKTKSFFAAPEHRTEGIERQLQRVEESVDTCVALRAREGQATARYLRTIAGGGDQPSPERVHAPRGSSGP